MHRTFLLAVLALLSAPAAASTADSEQGRDWLPGDHHVISANASKTKSAKLLAVFVVDTSETALTTPFGD